MTDIIITISKYLLIIFFGLFTISSFRAQKDVPDELKAGTFHFQRSMIIAIHAISFFVICLNVVSGNVELNIWHVIAFYIAQLAYLLCMTILLPGFVRLNPGLNNVMCMFLAIGFIIQTRLSFENSVRQFIIVIAGTVIFLIFCIFCKKAGFLRNLTWIYCGIGLALLLLVFIMSSVTRGAKLSIDIGSYSFQPLEFVKIIFVLFVASAFNRSSSFKMVMITAVLAAVHVLIQVMCNDLGSAFILFIIYIMMLYVATRRFIYIAIGTVGFAGACVAAYHLFNHVKIRVAAWLDPWSDIEDKGWQIAQSLFAIGTGGWLGSGLYRGNPGSVPLVSKDMVISAIAEELGGAFAVILILLCLCFTLMIFRVAIRIELTFYKLLAFGLGVCYAIQVFLTIGGACKFIPLTGVTLPFISSGGSSILASMLMLGIIQALYVISESDVAHERRMVAQGADISEFAGYEDLAEREDRVYPDPLYMDGRYREAEYLDGRYREAEYLDGRYQEAADYEVRNADSDEFPEVDNFIDTEKNDGSVEIVLKVGKDGRLRNIAKRPSNDWNAVNEERNAVRHIDQDDIE